MSGGLTSRRLGIVALCVLSVVVCTGLAWWQWQRFDTSGSWQNLGYVLQWPLFGVFPAFMFWRLRRLRAQEAAASRTLSTPSRAVPDDESSDVAPCPPSRSPEPASVPRVPARQDDDDNLEDPEDPEDPELAAYNRYLAQLNAADQQETR